MLFVERWQLLGRQLLEVRPALGGPGSEATGRRCSRPGDPAVTDHDADVMSTADEFTCRQAQAEARVEEMLMRVRRWTVEVDLSSFIFGTPWRPETREEWLARLERQIARALAGLEP